MPPRLRPEVIIPLRTSASWARTMLLSCCAFIMFVTTVDALRYASHRNTRARDAAARQKIEKLNETMRELKALRAQRPRWLCGDGERPGPTCFVTSPEPR